MSHRLDSAPSDGTPSPSCRPGNPTGEGNGEELARTALSKCLACDTCLEGSLAPLDSISGLWVSEPLPVFLSLSYPHVYERLLVCDTLEQHPLLLSALTPMSPYKLGTAEASPAWATSAPSVYGEHSGCHGVGFLTHSMKKWPFS